MAKSNRGRPKKPTELKVLEGNPGKRPIPMNEVKPKPLIPSCPKWLHKYAKQEWKELAPKLERLGLLSEIDGAAFAGYCQSYAKWREAEETLASMDNLITTTETGYAMVTPWVTMSQKHLKSMGTYLGKFGLSPSDRAGLVSVKGEETSSKLGSLLSG